MLCKVTMIATWWSYLTCRRPAAETKIEEKPDLETGQDPRDVEVSPLVLRIRIPRTESCERCDAVKVVRHGQTEWTCEPCSAGGSGALCPRFH